MEGEGENVVHFSRERLEVLLTKEKKARRVAIEKGTTIRSKMDVLNERLVTTRAEIADHARRIGWFEQELRRLPPSPTL